MYKLLIVFLCSISISNVLADDQYFNELWNRVLVKSDALKATENQSLVSEEDFKKASRHWLPEVYAGAASFMTNDPGANMFGLLSQRKITQSDFMPDSLNKPEMNHFTKASLGIEFPLYQGMAGDNYKKMTERLALADKLQITAVIKKTYREYIKLITNIQLIDNNLRYYFEKNNELLKLNSNYQVGNKENLLGYSGKLGIDNIKLKIKSTEEMLLAKKKTLLYALEEMTDSKIDLEKLSKIDIEKIWSESWQKGLHDTRDETKIFESQVKALEVSTDLAKARLRPQVALFADQTIFKGERDLADSQTIGLSVKWSIFSSENLSTESRALYSYYAAKNMHLAKVEEDKIQYTALTNYEQGLNANIENMHDSKKLLAEQSKATNKLFKNGLINILQHLEVFNQDLDLNYKIYEIEEKRIEIKADKLLYLKYQ